MNADPDGFSRIRTEENSFDLIRVDTSGSAFIRVPLRVRPQIPRLIPSLTAGTITTVPAQGSAGSPHTGVTVAHGTRTANRGSVAGGPPTGAVAAGRGRAAHDRDRPRLGCRAPAPGRVQAARRR